MVPEAFHLLLDRPSRVGLESTLAHASVGTGARSTAPLRFDSVDDADASEARPATELADRGGRRRFEQIEGRVVVGQEGRATMLDTDPLASERGSSTRDAGRPVALVRSGWRRIGLDQVSGQTVLLSAEGEPGPTLRSSTRPATYR